MKEQWRDIPGYVGFYQVSDQGRVRSVDRAVKYRGGLSKRKGRILKAAASHSGHLAVSLWRAGVGRTKLIHQLVMLAWIGPRPDGQEVRHGPSGHLDNSVGNLLYGTHKDNLLDMYRDKTHCGKTVRRSDGVEFPSMHVAARKTYCRHQEIWGVCNSRRKTAGGFGWEYV